MAKQISQFIELDHGTETISPGLEDGAPLKLLAKIMQVVKTLAASLQDRRRSKFVETYIPRQSHDDESRLEFERFIHW